MLFKITLIYHKDTEIIGIFIQSNFKSIATECFFISFLLANINFHILANILLGVGMPHSWKGMVPWKEGVIQVLAGIGQSSQKVGPLLRTPWSAKPDRKWQHGTNFYILANVYFWAENLTNLTGIFANIGRMQKLTTLAIEHLSPT